MMASMLYRAHADARTERFALSAGAPEALPSCVTYEAKRIPANKPGTRVSW